jgi:plasmid stabilization system protein ParE
MDYQVVLSPSARADLRDIVRYISIDNPDAAPRNQYVTL